MIPTERLPAADVVPHAYPMVLIDEILEVEEDSLVAAVTIEENNLFFDPLHGVGAWIGIEFMAQAISALAGTRAKKNNKQLAVGFLVGARRYEANSAFFGQGMKLIIRVKLQFETNEFGVFDCTIESGDLLITAQLNVFQPENLESYLA